MSSDARTATMLGAALVVLLVVGYLVIGRVSAPVPASAPSSVIAPSISPNPATASPQPTPVPSASATSPAGALPFAAQMAASDGLLTAALRLDVAAPSVAKTTVFAADARATPATWRTIGAFDAFPLGMSIANGRVALALSREPAGGGGGFSAEIVVIDAASSASSSIWSATFTPATFRGGGGGPKRAGVKVVLGGGRLAYTRLTEVVGGDLVGELRVRDLGNGRETVIGSSARWIEPIAFSGSMLAYSIGGDPLDEIREVDLASGAATKAIVQASLIRMHAYNGRWLLYTTTKNEQVGPYSVVLRDIPAGTERVLDPSGDRVSMNERYAVWVTQPARSSFRAFDLVDLRDRVILTPRASLIDLTAVPGGFVAHDMSSGFSTLSFLPSP